MSKPITPIVRTCCVIECARPAEWEIWSGEDSHDHTEACTDHVGALLGDHSAYRVFPLPPIAGIIHADCDDCGAPGILRPGDIPYCAPCWAKRCGHGTLLDVPCTDCQLIAVGRTRLNNRLTPAEWDRIRTRNLIGAPTRLPSRLSSLYQ